MKNYLLYVTIILSILLLLLGCDNNRSEDYKSQPASLNSFYINWYSNHLAALNEPSLTAFKNGQTEAYRFLWLRTFHNPVSVRIEVSSDNKGILFLKVADGKGGYEPGKIKIDRQTTLSANQIKKVRDNFRKTKFFNMNPTDEWLGTDGAQWYIEARKDNTFHWVNRWSPSDKDIVDLGLSLLKIAEYKQGPLY